MIAEIERSADLAVNICKAARRIYGHELDPQLRGLISKMGEQAQQLFTEAIEAYVASDAVRAAAIVDMDDYLDDLHRQFIQADLREPCGGVDRPPGRGPTRRRRPVLRADRRPRGERLGERFATSSTVGCRSTPAPPGSTLAAIRRRVACRSLRPPVPPTDVSLLGELLVALAGGSVITIFSLRRARTDDARRPRRPPAAPLPAEPDDEVARLRAAFDALPIGVVLADVSGTVIVRNKLASHAVGSRQGGVLVDEAADGAARRGARRPPRRAGARAVRPAPPGRLAAAPCPLAGAPPAVSS